MYRRHRKDDLLELLVNSIIDDGWRLIYERQTNEHPFELTVFNENVKYRLRIYIWNLTHGGGVNRPQNEYRVQFTSVSEFVVSEGVRTLVLGYWFENETLAAWDVSKHLGVLGASPSAQVKRFALENAHINGFGSYYKSSTKETVLTFQPQYLMRYVESMDQVHVVTASEENSDFFNKGVVSEDVNEAEPEKITARETVLSQVKKKIRDSSFKKRILNAYGNRCAMCSVQLKLIDAAHILPVQHNGNDSNDNGIALCAIHHRAYDSHLVTFDESYNIMINEKKHLLLQRLNLDSGFDKFKNDLRPMIILPPTIQDRPNVHYIRQANLLRGW